MGLGPSDFLPSWLENSSILLLNCHPLPSYIGTAKWAVYCLFFFFHIIISQQMSFKEGNNLSAVMKYSFDNMVLFSSISWGAVNLMWESFRRGAVSVFELLWATSLKKKEVYVVRRVLSFQWFLLCVVSCSNTTWVPVTCVTFGFGEFQSSTF